MPNLISRLARYVLRSRKRSASLQNSSSSPSAPEKAAASKSEELPPQDVNIEGETGVETMPVQTTPKVTSDDDQQTSGEEEKQSQTESKMNEVALKMSNGIQQSSTVRNRRVLRELRNMMKAAERPDTPFQVSLVDDDNLFEWEVKLLRVDETSDLWRSMQQTNIESINFRLTFPELFPFQPPFLRLVGPYLDNGFIMDGGAICMEVLTTQGWSSAYTIESLLVQVASGLTQGGAIVSRRQKRRYNRLTQKRAEIEFRRICKIHAKYGWVNMERDEL